jgi:hypothetical protein
MKTTMEKPSKGSRPRAKESDAFRLLRSRAGKRRGVALRTKGFLRALASVALSSPHTPILRRFHD